jgi:hypothetical protein
LKDVYQFHQHLAKPIRTIRASKVIIDTDNLGELTFEINPDGDEANENISKKQ